MYFKVLGSEGGAPRRDLFQVPSFLVSTNIVNQEHVLYKQRKDYVRRQRKFRYVLLLKVCGTGRHVVLESQTCCDVGQSVLEGGSLSEECQFLFQHSLFLDLLPPSGAVFKEVNEPVAHGRFAQLDISVGEYPSGEGSGARLRSQTGYVTELSVVIRGESTESY